MTVVYLYIFVVLFVIKKLDEVDIFLAIFVNKKIDNVKREWARLSDIL